MVLSYVQSGSTAEGEDHGIPEKCVRIIGKACSAVFSSKILALAKVFFTDVLFQKRLYRRSRSRWVIHSLIFYPFVFRFLWGMIALMGSLWKPEWPFVWRMLDKNQPVTAVLFDLTGVILILGIVFALVRGARKTRTRLPDLPKQDRIALVLTGGIVLVGFVLEGMRIAMTGMPEGAGWAFLGYGISELFTQGSHLVDIYGYVWHLHALLSGAFLAYLPFSRLLHIIVAPLTLIMNAASNDRH
jgi:nitrate reductase gamma subunit